LKYNFFLLGGYMKSIAIAAVCFALFSGYAAADPEKAYDAGKTVSEAMTGKHERVDDRDAAARGRDALRDAGARAGGAKSYNDSFKSGKDTDGKSEASSGKNDDAGTKKDE
jgi:hypothetical protein